LSFNLPISKTYSIYHSFFIGIAGFNCSAQCKIIVVWFRRVTVIRESLNPIFLLCWINSKYLWIKTWGLHKQWFTVERIFRQMSDYSITSITQLWKPWTYPLTATSRVTPRLSSKGITLHEMSSPNTQRVASELKTLEQKSYVMIELKRKN
jgi:hypothetical protein